MELTQTQMQSIISSVLSSIQTNSRTIEQLTPVKTLAATDWFEINGGKRVAFTNLKGIFAELIKQTVKESENNILQVIGGLSDIGGVSDDGMGVILDIKKIAKGSGILEFDVAVDESSELVEYPDGTRAWVSESNGFYVKEDGEVNILDSYMITDEPKADAIFRCGNQLFCWRDGKFMEYIAGLDDHYIQALVELFTPVLHISQLGTLGTNGSASEIISLVNNNPVTRYKVIGGPESLPFSIGYMDLLSDPMRHVVTEVFTTHLLLDEDGNLTENFHRCQDLRTYYRSLNINSPQLENSQGTWSEWRLLNGDEVHLDSSTQLISRRDLPGAVISFDGTVEVNDDEDTSLLMAPAGSRIVLDEERQHFYLQTGSGLGTTYYGSWGSNAEAGIPGSDEMGPWGSCLYVSDHTLWGMVGGRLTRLTSEWEGENSEGGGMILNPSYGGTIVDTGLYDAGHVYRHKYQFSAGTLVTEDCWHKGCRYRCMADGTIGVEPGYGKEEWAFISGDPEFRIDFEEKSVTYNPADIDSFEAELNLVATMYNQDVLAQLPANKIRWSRESYDQGGIRRLASDLAWTARTGMGNKRLLLDGSDLDFDGTPIKRISFLCKATLGEEEALASMEVAR